MSETNSGQARNIGKAKVSQAKLQADRLRQAAKVAGPRQPLPPPVVPAPPPPKKVNPRGAAARDARAKKRGRLPIGTKIHFLWDGATQTGKMILMKMDLVGKHNGRPVYQMGHDLKHITFQSEGLFQTAEMLDVLFWKWYSEPGDEAIKKQLVFERNPPTPDEFPKEQHATESQPVEEQPPSTPDQPAAAPVRSPPAAGDKASGRR